jgi:hypothetical protein
MTRFDWGILAFTTLIFAVILEVSLTDSNRYIKYDCRMADISVDMPLQIKQLCKARK